MSENNGWVGRGAGVGVCVLWQGGGGGGTEGAGGCKMRTGREIKTKLMNGSRNRNRIIYQHMYIFRTEARALLTHIHTPTTKLNIPVNNQRTHKAINNEL